MPAESDICARLRVRLAELHRQGLSQLLAQDPERSERFRLRCAGLRIDFSRNHIDGQSLQLLTQHAAACQLPERIADMFAGRHINTSENRPALHWLLRAKQPGIHQQNHDLIQHELKKLHRLGTAMRQKRLCAYTGTPFRHVINIGIGGSDTGIRLLSHALRDYQQDGMKLDFISNIDPKPLQHLLAQTVPAETLFIVSSKSFSTSETLHNAQFVWRWLQDNGCREPKKHFFAVTAKAQKAISWGIMEEHVLELWDWVGGRYSIWSSIALPVVLVCGVEPFQALLEGGESVDKHFAETPLADNAPVVLGLLDFCYRKFFAASSLAIIPYDDALCLLPEYLAQLVMESNGKGVCRDGQPCSEKTAPVIWGGIGSNCQHGFAQLLHQGTELIPVDFLAGLRTNGNFKHHALLFGNCLAQMQTLSQGEQSAIAYQRLPGNRPSRLILYPGITPRILGELLALYEHRTFVQAMLWGINPFDQWGVELGKHVAQQIVTRLEGPGDDTSLDASTRENIRLFRQCQTTAKDH